MRDKSSLIYVAGHTGMVGSSIVRQLQAEGYSNLLLRTHGELDLTDQSKTNEFFAEHRPDYVFLAAAKVGSMFANSIAQADYLYENLVIGVNVIKAAHTCGVKKLLNLGSSCIYPVDAQNPIKENLFLTGVLEPTNEGYAVAKCAIIKMCRYFNEFYGTNFISVMPPNVYGVNDDFELKTCHVLTALIRRFCEAKINGQETVTCFGTGIARREFLYVDDLAAACIKIMQERDAAEVGECVNIGYGKDISIKKLAEKIAGIVGYTGKICWDSHKPNGTIHKLMSSEKLHGLMDWHPKVSLDEGIMRTYNWYRAKGGIGECLLPSIKGSQKFKFEFHLTEHCNLNCKRCSHFCNVAEKEFLDIAEFARDVARMRELCDDDDVFEIHLLGGEPLLHPKVTDFMQILYDHFPDVVRRIVTNGILLDKMPKSFADTVGRTHTEIFVSKYPIGLDYDSMQRKWDGITKMTLRPKDMMRKEQMDIAGNQDGHAQYERCCNRIYCNTLSHGRFYHCMKVAYFGHVIKRFHLDIPNPADQPAHYLDIYKISSKEEIFDFLSQPIDFCRYCSFDNYEETVEWSRDEATLSDWLL